MNEKKSAVIDHFNQRSTEWGSLYSRPVFQQRLKLFVDSVQDLTPAPANVLDFGCGSGVISCELAKHGYKVTGVDAASGMVQSASENASKQDIANIEFSSIDSAGNGLPDAKYDAVVCSSVLEYVPNDEHLVLNLMRTLSPGGTLLISVPNAHSFIGKLEDLLVGLKVRTRGKTADVQFANKRYSEKDILTLFGANRSNEISVTYFELPLLGKLGEVMSRSKYFGVLTLVKVSTK